MAASVDTIRAGIQPLVEAAGAELEDLQIQQAGRREIVRVVLDRDGGVDLDLVAELSRQISTALELPALSDQFQDTYVLEVSSPGVDRPLTLAKHWRRSVDRLVEVELKDGSTLVGRVRAAADDEITLDVIEGKGTVTRVLPVAELVQGRVQVEFNRVTEEGAEDGH